MKKLLIKIGKFIARVAKCIWIVILGVPKTWKAAWKKAGRSKPMTREEEILEVLEEIPMPTDEECPICVVEREPVTQEMIDELNEMDAAADAVNSAGEAAENAGATQGPADKQ